MTAAETLWFSEYGPEPYQRLWFCMACVQILVRVSITREALAELMQSVNNVQHKSAEAAAKVLWNPVSWSLGCNTRVQLNHKNFQDYTFKENISRKSDFFVCVSAIIGSLVHLQSLKTWLFFIIYILYKILQIYWHETAITDRLQYKYIDMRGV